MKIITPVVLAAGDSSRMGYPKALLPLGDDTFLTRILKTLDALELPAARVVLGIHEFRIQPLLISRKVRVLTNPNPERGQVSSLRLALEDLDPDCGGCLIWPVDQPLVSIELVRNLIQLFQGSSAPLAMPRCEGKAGHPAIFGPMLIEELLSAPPDGSPKLIVARHKSQAAWLETSEKGSVEDVDTPEDYFRLTGETPASALAKRGHSDFPVLP
ncbi:MAG: nucleotidyltransferase family protein [Acidobacteriia bacterium]|nr:nucleotidyltransferase family protein [Terriglobia bacterium]